MTRRTVRPVPGTAVVIGGGIAGLATAALLGKEGFAVTVVEARDEVGGRAGSWEQDGFRWDTGPSWYLMPEVFDHFFEMMGTSAAAELDLVPLDPAYRIFSGPTAAPLDVRSGRAEATALFESIEPGAGAVLDEYLDSAADAYDLAVSRFLYDTYETTAGLRDPALLRRLPQLAPLLTRTLASYVEKRFTDRRLRQVVGQAAKMGGLRAAERFARFVHQRGFHNPVSLWICEWLNRQHRHIEVAQNEIGKVIAQFRGNLLSLLGDRGPSARQGDAMQ